MRITEIKDNFKYYREVNTNLIVGNLIETPPIYSILIPTYQRYELLKDAIDSALNQEGKFNYEIVIVDNDPIPNIRMESSIKSYSASNLFYYRNEENIGMVGNWNRCIELAKGKWVTFLHDDDLLFPNYLLEMNDLITRLPKFSLFAPSAYTEKGRNNPIIQTNTSEKTYMTIKLSDFFYSNLVPTQGTMFQKQNCIDLGGYNEGLFPGSDYIFWINYISKFNGIKLSQQLFSYRIIENETYKPETYLNSIKSIYIIRKELSALLNLSPFILVPYINYGLVFGIDQANNLLNCNIDKSLMLKQYNINKIWGSKLGKIVFTVLHKQYMLLIRLRQKHL